MKATRRCSSPGQDCSTDSSDGHGAPPTSRPGIRGMYVRRLLAGCRCSEIGARNPAYCQWPLVRRNASHDHTCIHAYTHTCTHTCIYPCMHMRIYAHTCMHACCLHCLHCSARDDGRLVRARTAAPKSTKALKMRRNEEDFTQESLASLSQMVQSAAGVRTLLALLHHAFQLTPTLR